MKMFVFEASSKIFRRFSTHIDAFDAKNFSCFSSSKAGLFKWNGGCMSDLHFQCYRRNAADRGNVFCVSRKRAPLLALVFDGLSIPILVARQLRLEKRQWLERENHNTNGNGSTHTGTVLIACEQQ